MSLALTLPSEADIAREIARDVDPDAIFVARTALRDAVGEHLAAALAGPLPARSPTPAPTGRTPRAPDAARCATPASISWWRRRAPGAIALAAQQYRDADNMTDRMAALTALSQRDVPERAAALDDFYERYQDNALVIDKWLALQAVDPGAGDAGARQGADLAPGVLDEQSQSRARAVRRVRDVEPDPAQSFRRRRLRSPHRHRAHARSRRIRRSPRASSPRSRAGACSNPGGAHAPKRRCARSPHSRRCRATSTTSFRARSCRRIEAPPQSQHSLRRFTNVGNGALA